ncbi:MAG: hypothetical protein V1921_08695 [Candidatus Altiarchaeota archaeon]
MAETTSIMLAAAATLLALGYRSLKAKKKMGLIYPDMPYDRYHIVR